MISPSSQTRKPLWKSWRLYVIQLGNNTKLGGQQEHQHEECRCEMCLGAVSGLVWWEPCTNPIKQGHFPLEVLLFLFSLQVSTSEYISNLSTFRGFYVVALFLCHKWYDTCKKHVHLFFEETRISITWEDTTDLIGKTWRAHKKKKKRVLNLGYLSQERRGLKITAGIRWRAVVCW